jgi:short-subunit dehydrogenase
MKTRRATLDATRFGPWALVTGASSGIGREFAAQLAANGFNLVLVARRVDALRELGEDLAIQYGIEFRAIGLDLAQPDFLDQLVRETRDLDIGLVISNAGTAEPGAFLAADLDALHQRLRLNTAAHLDLTHHFGQQLARRGRGGILLVSAAGSRHSVPNMASDAAAKTYVLVLGKALHTELAPRGVTVTVLLPGATDTPAMEQLGFDRDATPMKPTPAVQVAVEGLAALRANERTHIAGRLNRVMDHVVPSGVTSKIMGRVMGQAAQRLADRNHPVDSPR